MLMFDWQHYTDSLTMYICGDVRNGADVILNSRLDPNRIVTCVYVNGGRVSKVILEEVEEAQLYAEDLLMMYGVSPDIETKDLHEEL